MICAGNWPPVAYEAPTPLYPSAQADAAVPTQQDTIKKGELPRPLTRAAHAAGSIYCEKYDCINGDIRDHVVIFTLHLLQRMTLEPMTTLRKIIAFQSFEVLT